MSFRTLKDSLQTHTKKKIKFTLVKTLIIKAALQKHHQSRLEFHETITCKIREMCNFGKMFFEFKGQERTGGNQCCVCVLGQRASEVRSTMSDDSRP